MKKEKAKITGTKICNYISAVLLVVVIVMMFLPFWEGPFEEKKTVNGVTVTVTNETVSIADYVWNPNENKNFERWLAEEIYTAERGEEIYETTPESLYKVNRNAFSFVHGFQLLIGFVGAIFLIVKAKNFKLGIVPGVVGFLGLFGVNIPGTFVAHGFLSSPYLHLGNWKMYVVINAILLVMFVATLVIGIIEKRNDRIAAENKIEAERLARLAEQE